MDVYYSHGFHHEANMHQKMKKKVLKMFVKF